MELHQALRSRSSVRAFEPRPVPEATLERALRAALESPSWANTQPYKLALANGEACEALRREMRRAAEGEIPNGDHPLLFDYPAELQARRRATGFGLYAAMGIERHDRERREEQYRRNFDFFGASAVAFLYAHEALGSYSVLDAGLFLQSFLLAAKAEGLGTCAQASLASYPHVVRRHFDVPEGYRLLCGVAIGWPAAAAENRFRPTRMPLHELVLAPRVSADAAAGGVPDDPGSLSARGVDAPSQ